MNINFFNILIISGVIHGIIFSLIILSNKRYRSKSSPYLAFVVFFLSLHNFYYWIGDVNLDQKIPYYANLYIPWNLLILPMYYFFVQEYFHVQKKNRRYYLIPFSISLIIHLYLFIDAYYSNYTNKEYTAFMIVFYYSEEYISLIFTVFVIIKTFYLIREKEKKNLILKNKIKIETNWLKRLLIFGLFICFIWLLLTGYSQINKTGQFNTSFRYFLWLSISVLVYWLGYLGVYHGLIFKHRKKLKKRIKNENPQIILNNNPKIEKVKKIIEKEKLFLDSDININVVSEKLGISESYFSRIFNENSSDSFSIYLRKLRVSEAKKILVNQEYRNYTIIAIGLESGFNSKSAFYKIFKEETGLTPSEYRKKNMS